MNKPPSDQEQLDAERWHLNRLERDRVTRAAGWERQLQTARELTGIHSAAGQRVLKDIEEQYRLWKAGMDKTIQLTRVRIQQLEARLESQEKP